MDLHLEEATVLLLGPGDEWDRAILRTLASEGAWTYATQSTGSTTDLAQHGSDSSHWVITEDHLDAASVARMSRFLAERGRPATAIVLHIDVIEGLGARRPVRWWRLRSEARAVMRQATEILESAMPDVGQSLLLFYELNDHGELDLAARWLRRTMSGVVRRSAKGARVNSVLVGPGDVDAGAGAVVALLCAPMTQSITGALIPMDHGTFARTFVDE
jgi:hypothetical protein